MGLFEKLKLKPFADFEDWWEREGIEFHFKIEKEKLKRVFDIGYALGKEGKK